MRKIAVLEWIRGGGMSGEAEEAIPSSLLREGTAMLDALVRLLIAAGAGIECCVDSRWGTDDLLQSEHVQYIPVHGTRDQRVDPISAHAACPQPWLQVAARCDYGLIVAPELDGILERTTRQLREAGVRLLNCEPPLLGVASDKWHCFERWSARGLYTPATTLLSELDDAWMQVASATLCESANDEWILKPRDGAGSEGLLPIHATSAIELRKAVEQMPGDPRDGRFIVQPWVPGRAFSRCVVVDRGGKRHWLPLMTQELSPEFKYLGGKVVTPGPLPDPSQSSDSLSHESWNERIELIAEALAGGETAGNLESAPRTRQTEARWVPALSPAAIRLDVSPPSDRWCNALLDALGDGTSGGGALGWLGFDLLLTPVGSWMAIECNPRCTTSIVHLAGTQSSNPV